MKAGRKVDHLIEKEYKMLMRKKEKKERVERKKEDGRKEVSLLKTLDEASREATEMRVKANDALKKAVEAEGFHMFTSALQLYQTCLGLLERADVLDSGEDDGTQPVGGMMGEYMSKSKARTTGRYTETVRDIRVKVEEMRKCLDLSPKYETKEGDPEIITHAVPGRKVVEQKCGVDEKSTEVHMNIIYPKDIAYGLSDVKGQDHARGRLMAFIAQRSVIVGGDTKKHIALDKSAAVLYGVPGTGKTMLTKALAKDMDMPIVVIDPTIFKPLVGQSEERMKSAMDKARELGRCIIFIDEYDRMFDKNGAVSGDHVGSKVASVMMTNLVEIEEAGMRGENEIVIIAATNHPMSIETAHMRRLGTVIRVGLPTEEGRRQIMEAEMNTSSSLSLVREHFAVNGMDEVIRLTEGWTSEEVKIVLRQASNVLRDMPPDEQFQFVSSVDGENMWKYPVDEGFEGRTCTYIDYTRNKEKYLSVPETTLEHFMACVREHEVSTREEDVQEMAEFDRAFAHAL